MPSQAACAPNCNAAFYLHLGKAPAICSNRRACLRYMLSCAGEQVPRMSSCSHCCSCRTGIAHQRQRCLRRCPMGTTVGRRMLAAMAAPLNPPAGQQVSDSTNLLFSPALHHLMGCLIWTLNAAVGESQPFEHRSRNTWTPFEIRSRNT